MAWKIDRELEMFMTSDCTESIQARASLHDNPQKYSQSPLKVILPFECVTLAQVCTVEQNLFRWAQSAGAPR